MAPTKPSLTPARPGMPITVGAWKSLTSAIGTLYDTLGTQERVALDVAVASRGQTISGARVLAIPVDPIGASLAAAPPLDGGVVHRCAALSPGAWTLVVEARGFTSATRPLQLPLPGNPPATVAIELTRTTVPAPDLVDLPLSAAGYLLGWASLPSGSWEVWTGGSGGGEQRKVLMQGPTAGVEIRRGTPINALMTSLASQLTPTRTIVPDFLGWPAGELPGHADYFQLAIKEDNAAKPGARVVWQQPVPGTVVALPATLHVRYGEPPMTKFGPFEGTHAALKDTLVTDVVAALKSHPAVLAVADNWTPWPVARTYVAGETFDELLAVFAGLKTPARVTDRRVDLEAIWRSLNVATHWAMPAGGPT